MYLVLCVLGLTQTILCKPISSQWKHCSYTQRSPYISHLWEYQSFATYLYIRVAFNAVFIKRKPVTSKSKTFVNFRLNPLETLHYHIGRIHKTAIMCASKTGSTQTWLSSWILKNCHHKKTQETKATFILILWSTSILLDQWPTNQIYFLNENEFVFDTNKKWWTYTLVDMLVCYKMVKRNEKITA
jgi:hypothetical protein